MPNDNFLFIISAPSGTGKTTILKKILEKYSNEIEPSISFTTRKPRANEINNKDYNFISIEEYNNILSKNDFLENAKVFDNYYGTSKNLIKQIFERKKNALLEIDWQGMQTITRNNKENKFNIITLFIAPPSYEEVKNRLKKRGESEEIIIKRTSNFQEDLQHANQYDYIIINDNLEDTINQINHIYEGSKILFAKNSILEKLNQIARI